MKQSPTNVLEPANPRIQASSSCCGSLPIPSDTVKAPLATIYKEQPASFPDAEPRQSNRKRMLGLVSCVDFRRIPPPFSCLSGQRQRQGSQTPSTSITTDFPRNENCRLPKLVNIFRAAKHKFKSLKSLRPGPTSQNNNRPKTPPSITIIPSSPHRLPSTYTKKTNTTTTTDTVSSRPPSPQTPPIRISPWSSHSSLPSLLNDGRSSMDSDTLRPVTPPPVLGGFDIFEPRGAGVIVGGEGRPYLARLWNPLPANVIHHLDNREAQRQRLGQQGRQGQQQGEQRGARQQHDTEWHAS